MSRWHFSVRAFEIARPLSLAPVARGVVTAALLATCPLGAAVLGGCASGAAQTSGPAARPSDATVSLAVPGVPGAQGAWYMVEADGTLRASLGQRTHQTPAPPIVRVLSAQQWDEVWTLAREAATREQGAAPSDTAVPAVTPAGEPDPAFERSGANTSAMGLEVRASGITRRLARPDPAATAALEAKLRGLAWAPRQ